MAYSTYPVTAPLSSIQYIFDHSRRLKAKRALFSSKGRSLSLASFSLPVKKVPKLLPLVKQRSSSPKAKSQKPSDEKYLEENKAQGELEILGLESLIDISDVQNLSKNKA